MCRGDGCSLDGWLQLDHYCTDCFAKYKIRPALDRACLAEQQLQILNDALYDVQVAKGERPYPRREFIHERKLENRPNLRLVKSTQPQDDTLEDMD